MVTLNILINDRVEGYMWMLGPGKPFEKYATDNQGNWFTFVVPREMVNEIVDSAKTNPSYLKYTVKDA